MTWEEAKEVCCCGSICSKWLRASVQATGKRMWVYSSGVCLKMFYVLCASYVFQKKKSGGWMNMNGGLAGMAWKGGEKRQIHCNHIHIYFLSRNMKKVLKNCVKKTTENRNEYMLSEFDSSEKRYTIWYDEFQH